MYLSIRSSPQAGQQELWRTGAGPHVWGTAQGKEHGLDARHCLGRLTEQLAEPHAGHTHGGGVPPGRCATWSAGEGRGWSSNTKHSPCLHRCQSRHCTLPLGICGWQCLLSVLYVGVHRGIVLYCYKLDDAESQQPGVLWLGRGKIKKPSSQKPGDSATMSKVKKGHTETGKKPSCWNFQLVQKVYIFPHTWVVI